MNLIRKCVSVITLISVLMLCGCSNNPSNNMVSSNRELNADYTGLWQHIEYPDSYSIIIYEQSGSNLNLVASAMQGDSYGRMVSIRNENLPINEADEAVFDYQDTNGNTGIGHLLLKGDTVFLAFTANEPYQGGFCIDAINGDFTKTKELSEMDYFDPQEYGVDLAPSSNQNGLAEIPHGKEIDAFDIIDYTVYYQMIGDDKYNEDVAFHFSTENTYEREHGGNIVEQGQYVFYKSNNSEYDFMVSMESNKGKYIMFYGNTIKEKDIIELYEYNPDNEYPISWYGKYITQVYAHHVGNMVR